MRVFLSNLRDVTTNQLVEPSIQELIGIETNKASMGRVIPDLHKKIGPTHSLH
jgi:hypothetical protein